MTQNRRDIGIISTTIFHVIVLLLMFLFGFKTYFPLPDEEGIEVNFGDSNVGSGQFEPAMSYTPPQQTNTNSAQPQPSNTNSKEEVMTQDFEDAATIEEKKRKEEQRKIAEEQQKREQEAERKRLEDIERKKQEEEQKKLADAQKITGGAFGAAQNSSNSQGEGTGGQGNQGDPSGNPNSGNRGSGQGTGSSGQGLGKAGISVSLDRKSVV